MQARRGSQGRPATRAALASTLRPSPRPECVHRVGKDLRPEHRQGFTRERYVPAGLAAAPESNSMKKAAAEKAVADPLLRIFQFDQTSFGEIANWVNMVREEGVVMVIGDGVTVGTDANKHCAGNSAA